MPAPRVVSVVAASPAARAGIEAGDELVSVEGRVPRDVIEYRFLVDEADPRLRLRRGDRELEVVVAKEAGAALGAEVSSAVFDRVRTCDNHCEFCFIYQLPKGMRRSLYLKDDDYRLSFLYGNFTTLTRFTELDLERVVTERLSPLFVSIHSTDPELRARMLRNPRGATSLRWLRALIDAGIEVHGQVVVCPGVNDGDALETTMAGILDRFPELATVALVPLGLSRFSNEPAMRPHSRAEAEAVLETVGEWQEIALTLLGRRLVFAADEYYLMARRPFPTAEEYEGFPQHENGVGMARALEAAFGGDTACAQGVRPGFFSWVDGAPQAGYRAPRLGDGAEVPGPDPRSGSVTVITGVFGAQVLSPVLRPYLESGLPGGGRLRLLPVDNHFFGGTIAVTGLLTGADVAAALEHQPAEGRLLLPDVCLSGGVFLDGMALSELPRPVEVVATDGRSLARALGIGGAPLATPVPVSLAAR